MNCITISISEEPQELAVGKSKFFGAPDVPEDFEWPQCACDGDLADFEGETFDLEFLCQINCKEIAKYDIENKLPHKGMLYFFYNVVDMPLSGLCDGLQGAKVVYVSDASGLVPVQFTDEDGNEMEVSSYGVKFGTADTYDYDMEEMHQLLGANPSAASNGFCYDVGGYGQLLLQIASFEREDVGLEFTDGGELCFVIPEKDLESCDFSNVTFEQIFS